MGCRVHTYCVKKVSLLSPAQKDGPANTWPEQIRYTTSRENSCLSRHLHGSRLISVMLATSDFQYMPYKVMAGRIPGLLHTSQCVYCTTPHHRVQAKSIPYWSASFPPWALWCQHRGFWDSENARSNMDAHFLSGLLQLQMLANSSPRLSPEIKPNWMPGPTGPFSVWVTIISDGRSLPRQVSKELGDCPVPRLAERSRNAARPLGSHESRNSVPGVASAWLVDTRCRIKSTGRTVNWCLVRDSSIPSLPKTSSTNFRYAPVIDSCEISSVPQERSKPDSSPEIVSTMVLNFSRTSRPTSGPCNESNHCWQCFQRHRWLAP